MYQCRVVDFLRQDDIISIIVGRYDGPITDELRYCALSVIVALLGNPWELYFVVC